MSENVAPLPVCESTRLTLVISSLAMGGAERVMSTLANAWAAAGLEIALITFDDGLTPPFFALHPDIRLVRVEMGLEGKGNRILNNLRAIRRLRAALAATRPQVVLSFMDIANILTLLAGRGLGFPVIVAERTNPERNPIRRAWKVIRPWCYRRAAAVVVQTVGAADFFRGHIASSRLRVIPNPVNVPELAPRSFLKRERVILAVGRLVPEKGFDVLLRAYARIESRHPEWTLRILGEGEARPALETLIRGLRIENRAELPGAVRDVPAKMFEAQIFVLSSRFEGFPNALAEAMACELAVVATDCRFGPRDIIQDGVDGVLVPVDDDARLAEALEGLMENTDRRAALARSARETMARYAPEKILRQWNDALEGALGHPFMPVDKTPGRDRIVSCAA